MQRLINALVFKIPKFALLCENLTEIDKIMENNS